MTNDKFFILLINCINYIVEKNQMINNTYETLHVLKSDNKKKGKKG